MRLMMAVILLGANVWAQGLVEHAAAAAGGSAGGVAGKKVSDGLSAIFNKVDKQTAKAAASTKGANAPLVEVGPGVPSGAPSDVPDRSSHRASKRNVSLVPPPPAVLHRAALHKPEPEPVPAPIPAPIAAPPPPPPPPPPDVTAADLKTIAAGAPRAAVLKLGPPSSRITMIDEGHLIEIFRYMSKDDTVGVVRLSDGAVTSVRMP